MHAYVISEPPHPMAAWLHVEGRWLSFRPGQRGLHAGPQNIISGVTGSLSLEPRPYLSYFTHRRAELNKLYIFSEH